MYYPDVTDSAQARTLDVTAGPVAMKADFRLRADTAVHVRGRVVDKQTGQPPRNVTIAMHAGTIGEGSSKMVTDYRAETGAFEITDVRAGSYTVTAVATNGGGILGALSAALENNAASNPPRGGRAAAKSATLHIDVSTADVDNVFLKLAESVNLEGHLEIAGGAPMSAFPSQRVHVRLVSTALPAPSQTALEVVANSRPQIQQDGSFTVTTETNCSCDLVVAGLPADAYIDSVRFGNVPIDGTRLTIPDPIPGPLQVTIATNGGRIEGTIVDNDGHVLKGIEAVLVPEKRTRQDLYKTAVSDMSGQFTLQGIQPGSYKLFAWRDIEANAYRVANILRPFESRGQAVDIKDSTSVKVRVSAIP